MIALEDCIGLCGFDEDEVAAISEHEHIPEIAAADLANYLSTTFTKLSTRVASDTLRVFMALRHFLEQHPEGRAGLAVE